MKNTSDSLLHYYKMFQKHLGARIYLIFALTMVAALFEGFGILMLLPLLQRLDTINNSVIEVQSVTIDNVTNSTDIGDYLLGFLNYLGLSDSIATVLVVIAISFIIKGALTFVALAYNANLTGQLLRELKSDLFTYYSQMQYGYYVSKDTGYFINVINEQVSRSMQSFSSFTQLGAHIVNTAVYLILAFLVAWRFGLMAVCAGIILLLIFRRLSAYVLSLSRLTAKENGHLSKLLIQTLQAFKYLTSTHQTPTLEKNVMTSIGNLTDYQVRSGISAGLTQSVREPIAVTLIMSILMLQIFFLGQSIEPILVSIVLFHRGLNSILAIQGARQTMLEYVGSMELVHEEIRMQYQYKEKDGPIKVGSLTQGIVFDNVYFSYNSKHNDIIQGISLKIPAKTSIALVGGSGAGKSTLVDLLTLMIKPRQGEVLIDSVSSEDIELESWRRQIGYVSQETIIFDDSIFNNICMGFESQDKGENLSDRIKKAAQQANISDYIESLPDGYQTLVGDRGIRLSGGQRQRLFIARELFREPKLLILDEATSALDSESERSIQESIDKLNGTMTVVIIAHRLSTIRNVDRIYVLDSGRLIEQGTYQQLRNKKDSKFSSLIAMQEL